MIAAQATVDEVREAIGATSLAYLSLDGLQAATRRPADALCRACLTRDYPTRAPDDAAKHRFEPAYCSESARPYRTARFTCARVEPLLDQPLPRLALRREPQEEPRRARRA